MPIPEDTLRNWVQRDQQIYVAESLAPLAASLHHREILQGRDVVWYIDNIGACSALIKGNSSQHDAGIVTAACHLLWAKLSVRMWIEWVASDDNPSDGLSRFGLLDTWTLQQTPTWKLVNLTPPPCFSLLHLPSVQIHEFLQSF